MPRQHADRAGFLVRILAAGSHRPVGVGFLVDDAHLVTCAHVVNTALGRAERVQDEPDPDVRVPVDFPILGGADGAPVRLCRVARWLPPPRSGVAGDDMAGLTITGEGPPAAAGPARLMEGATPPTDGVVHVFGNPATRQSGAWVTARIRGRVGGGMLQVDSDTAAAVRLQPGYSGSPLVFAGPDGDAVVGMLSVASTRDDSRDAYGVAVDRLVRAWPDVLASIPPCPYRGLRPFTPADERVFVGREDDTGQLLELIAEDTLALVVGPSGVGKSSLVNAGLIPRWRAAGGVAVAIRPGPATAEPLRGVLAELNAALSATTRLDTWSLDVEQVAGGLAEAVARRADSLGMRVLIHLDQFEELLTATAEHERRHLVDVLLPASRDPAGSCRIVVTMRADHLPELLELPGQGTRLRNRLLALSPMGVAALERAVTEPALACGVVYESGLAEQIAADASGGPGGLPLMAFALARLWETQRGRRIGFAEYRRFGGVAGAIDEYAERVYDALRAEGQAERTKAIMLALVRSRGGAADAVSRAVARDRFDGVLVDHLCRVRLLVSETSGSQSLVRLAHESLVRAWTRFARWVDEDADFQRWLATMEERVADDELLSESRLGPAEQWLAERRADIPAEVVQLVERSRSVWRRRVAELEQAKTAAEAAAAEAEARRLAPAAELLTATTAPGGTLPLVLASESIRTLWTVEGDTALRHTLRTAPVPIARIPAVADGYVTARLTSTGSHVVRDVVDVQRKRGSTELYEVDVEQGTCSPIHQADRVVRVSPDGRAVLHTDSHRVAAIDVRTGTTLVEDSGRLPLVSAEFAENGTRLAVLRGHHEVNGHAKVTRDATVTVFELATGKVCHQLKMRALRGSACFNPDCTMLVATTNRYDDGQYKWLASTTVFDLASGEELAALDHDGDPTGRLVFGPGSRLLAAGSNDVDSCGDSHSGGLEVFDLSSGGRLLYRLQQYLPVKAIAFARLGQHLAVAVGDSRHAQTPGFGILVDATTGRERRRLHHDYPVNHAGFNADGSRVFFTGYRSARVFAVFSGDELLRVDHEQELSGVVFTPDGRGLVTVTQEHGGPIRVFRSGSVEVARFDWPERHMFRNAHSTPDGGTVVASFYGEIGEDGDDGDAFTLVIDPMRPERHDTVWHGPHACATAVSADGARMALVDISRLTVQSLRDGSAPVIVDDGSTHGVRQEWFTEDGGQLVTVGLNIQGRNPEVVHSVLRRTDARTGATQSSVTIAGKIRAATRDAALAAVIAEGEAETTGHSTVAVIDTGEGRERFRFRARNSDDAVRFSPDGEWIASLCGQSLVLRRSTDGEPLWSTDLDLGQNTHHPTANIVVSPTGTCLAVIENALGHRAATLVAAADGRHVAKFGSTGRITAARFSLDGHRLAVVIDGAAHVVDVDTAGTLCVVEHEVHDITDAGFVGSAGDHLLTMDKRCVRVSSVDATPLLHDADTRLARELTESERRRYLRRE